MIPARLRRIVMENPSRQMRKHEDWPGLETIPTLRAWQKEGALRPLGILCETAVCSSISKWNAVPVAP